MSPEFTPTGLKLAQHSSVAAGTIVVPNLAGPKAAGTPPFYTTREQMVFHAVGDGSKDTDVRLMVQVNLMWPSATVAPDTVSRLSSKLGVEIHARRLTRRERIWSFGKAEVVLAGIGLLLVIAAFITTFVTPSSDQQLGRADLAVQLQPIEQRLAAGISAHDPAAVQGAQQQLGAALRAADRHGSDDVTTGSEIATLALGLISGGIACRIAWKRAKTGL